MCGNEMYSLNDWLEDKEKLDRICYKEDIEKTYLWFFENEPYELIEVIIDKPGIISSKFIYEGR